MATMSEKPCERYNVPDWFTANHEMSSTSEQLRGASHDVRQDARRLRNETDITTRWDTHRNTQRLLDRTDDIQKWRETLQLTLNDVNQEISMLETGKDLCERELEAMAVPLDVAIENMALREGRVKIDLVRDSPEQQIKKEANVIDGVKQALKQKCDEAFEQLCLLQEIRQQLEADLQDKTEAFDIDLEQAMLTKDSPNISYKPNPLRVPAGTVTPQEWEAFSRYNKERADSEMRSSTRLREAIQAQIAQAKNDLEAQKEATELEIRKRVHEMERALDELRWQKKNTEDEIMTLEGDIRDLERSIKDKVNPSKLAQTRLENRTYRPGVELCRDEPQYGLTDEVKQLEVSSRALEDKFREAKAAWNRLQDQLHRIDEDIKTKSNSLDIDKQVIDSRRKLSIYRKPTAETDRNLLVTGVDRSGMRKVLAMADH